MLRVLREHNSYAPIFYFFVSIKSLLDVTISEDAEGIIYGINDTTYVPLVDSLTRLNLQHKLVESDASLQRTEFLGNTQLLWGHLVIICRFRARTPQLLNLLIHPSDVVSEVHLLVEGDEDVTATVGTED